MKCGTLKLEGYPFVSLFCYQESASILFQILDMICLATSKCTVTTQSTTHNDL